MMGTAQRMLRQSTPLMVKYNLLKNLLLPFRPLTMMKKIIEAMFPGIPIAVKVISNPAIPLSIPESGLGLSSPFMFRSTNDLKFF